MGRVRGGRGLPIEGVGGFEAGRRWVSRVEAGLVEEVERRGWGWRYELGVCKGVAGEGWSGGAVGSGDVEGGWGV